MTDGLLCHAPFIPLLPAPLPGQDAEDFPGEPQKSRLKRCRRRDAARCIEFAEKVEMEIMGCHCWTNPIHGEHLTRIAFEIQSLNSTLQCTSNLYHVLAHKDRLGTFSVK